MHRPIISQNRLFLLVAPAIVLPIATLLVVALSVLVAKMGDPAGGRVLGWIAVGAGLVWLLDLVCLVLALAVQALDAPEQPRHEETEL
jgi:hypothetical protein